MSTNLYKILNVEKNATDDELRKAYKKMILKYHPDKNSDIDSNKKFEYVKIAYDTLSNKQKRFEYDLSWHVVW